MQEAPRHWGGYRKANIVGASSASIAENLARSLGGQYIGQSRQNVAGLDGLKATMQMHQVSVKGTNLFVHDRVYKRNYSSLQKGGITSAKGFSIQNEGGKVLHYRLNSRGDRFTNAYSRTAGELLIISQNTPHG